MSFATQKMLDNYTHESEKDPGFGVLGSATMVSQVPTSAWPPATRTHPPAPSSKGARAPSTPVTSMPGPFATTPTSYPAHFASPYANLPASLSNPHAPYLPLDAKSFAVADESQGVKISVGRGVDVQCVMADDEVASDKAKMACQDVVGDNDSTCQLSQISREFRRSLGQGAGDEAVRETQSRKKSLAKRLDAAIGEYQENFCALDVGMSNHRDEIAKLKTQLGANTDTLSADLESTKTNVKRLETVVKNLRGDGTSGVHGNKLHEGLLAQKAAIESHAKTSKAALEAHAKTSNAALEAHVKTSNAAVAGLQARVDSSHRDAKRATELAGTLTSRVGQSDGKIVAIDNGLRAHKTVLESHDAKITSMMAAIDKLGREPVVGARGASDSKIVAIDDGLRTHKRLLEAHDAKITSMMAKMEKMEKMEKMDSSATGVARQVKEGAVGRQIKELHEGVLAHKASIEAIHASSTSSLKKLQSDIAGMQADVKTNATSLAKLEDHLRRNINPTKLLPHQVLNAAVDAYRSKK